MLGKMTDLEGKDGPLAYFANRTYTEVPRYAMPTRNVNLTPELDCFIASRVKSGHYANASEVMRTALRLLEREEREYEEKLAALRVAIQKGLESGEAEPRAFDRLYSRIDASAAEGTKPAGPGDQEDECRRTA